ncbi:MAG TPA: ABC transporter substrate-binding protein [Microvirga sp.]|nr:ABC transporter substrate-binding protein [Microvirga sp.]
MALLGGAVWPLAARAQQQDTPVIGWLHSGSPGPHASTLEAFRRGLGEVGFVEGSNLTIVYRWAEDRFDRLPRLARDLVERKVTLVFAGGGDVTALAAKSATATIPIVFAIGADPVRHGIVESFNRPGGNITGVSFLAVAIRPKMLELLRELLPKVAVIAVIANPNRPDFDRAADELLESARAMGLAAHLFKAGNEHEIASAFAAAAHARVDAVLMLSDPVYTSWRDLILRLEASHAIPTIHSAREHVVAGGLISYGASVADAYRQAGVYAGRVLRGARPTDLPVIQPTKFELVINLKTAKALGLEVPPTLLARADEVIE